ncbi:1-aminocyclopropane-1-carboxylate synthase-like protein 1, partial [Exaiptasia diaphana]
GIKIRALLLVNPNNPFGYIYTEEEIQEYLQFAHRNDIHVIMDELYLLSIFKEGCTMKSVLSCKNIPDPKRLHVLWGLSKVSKSQKR